jgi:hypothetical protein
MRRDSLNNKGLHILFLFLLLIVLGIIVFLKFIRPYEEDSRQVFRTMMNSGTKLGVVAHPLPSDISKGKIFELPIYDPKSGNPWQIDLRGADVSEIEASKSLESLSYADFDDHTRWPEKLPDGYSPSRIMQLGKNPGLGIRQLHLQGIMGKGIGIAIIDQTLLVDHVEYKDNLRLYEEIHSERNQASIHGPAVASIAVGKTVGIAPEADLYYISEFHGKTSSEGLVWDLAHLARAIDRIIEIDHSIPQEKKIRVLSISVGWSPKRAGYNKVVAAVDRAKKAGIFIVSTAISDSYGAKFHLDGLGRKPDANPDQSTSYTPGIFRIAWFLSATQKTTCENTLLIPMDSRCTASPTGNSDYVFYRIGGLSWSVPYVAGLYALACQVSARMTPEIFWDQALATGDPLEYEIEGKRYLFGKIVNPIRMFSVLKSKTIA